MHILGNDNSIFNQFVAEIRDEKVQKDAMRFRRNLERCGEIFAYEISKTLHYEDENIITPLGEATVSVPSKQPVIATILRAGLPMHQGLLNFFDKAENAFISAYRKHDKNEETFTIKMEYLSSPDIDGKTLIISDPMLATGASMITVINAIKEIGIPSHIHVVSLIASKEGLSYVKRNTNSDNITLWLGFVDDELTASSYIVPGLGDAGDLAYGKKRD
jgi:uracil phosphoribosyltransferase